MTNKDYPPLPDFDAVEQHVYGACRRYVSQDMLEPIYNLMRDYVDVDRAMRAQAAPEYSEAMGVAGQAYFESVGKHAHPLPAMWRWSEVYEAMLAATPSAPVAEQKPVAWWIPKAEQFCLAKKNGERPFAKSWEPLYAAPSAPAAPQPAAPQDEFLPLLARDIANELGTTSINVCEALRTLGFGCFSLNMAITKTMAAKLLEHFATHPAEGVPAQGDAELLAEAKSEGYESSLAYVQALKQHVATYRAERNSAREAHRRVRAEGDAELDTAFEAVRRRLCKLPRYSFHSDGYGAVRRVNDKSGSWIEFSAAHELFDPIAVDGAVAKKGGQ